MCSWPQSSRALLRRWLLELLRAAVVVTFMVEEMMVEEEVIVECHGKLDQESAEAKASKSFVEWCVHEPPAILTPCPCRARA